MDIRERIKVNEAQSSMVAEQLRGTSDFSAFRAGVERYILLRFLLDDEPDLPQSLDSLAKRSIALTLERTGNPASLSDLGINCAGASSALTKRILVIIALRKALGVDIDLEQAAAAATVDDLAVILYNAVRR